MSGRLVRSYDRWVLQRSKWVVLLTAVLLALALSQVRYFKLDASADSLTLEQDVDVAYYRDIRAQFPSNDDFLVVAAHFEAGVFHPQSLDTLASLKRDLSTVGNVASINSILDVPLLNDPDISLTSISEYIQTLEDSDVDIGSAKKELMSNPLYQNMLVSQDGRTTAIQLNLKADQIFEEYFQQREMLRKKRLISALTIEEQQKLAALTLKIKALSPELIEQDRLYIQDIREILSRYEGRASLFLGGVPMIVVDMIEYVRSDLKVFGIGVLLFLACTLIVIFRRAQWVVLPLFCCLLTALAMVGYLGWARFPVTVISSNFISLLLIITMSMIIHLVVRYREYAASFSELTQSALVLKTIASMARPCLYTSLTTMVAFGSLLISGIRPVIDFGFMMTAGVVIAYLFAFLLFPAILVLMPKEQINSNASELPISGKFAKLTDLLGNRLLIIAAGLGLICLYGITQLTVENRFIDYFKESTEIYQGMKTIDQSLGGTVPLDIIVQFDMAEKDDTEVESTIENNTASLDEELEEDCFLDDECLDDVYEESTFFTQSKVSLIKNIHQYLESLPEVGKVLSLATTIDIADRIKGAPLETLELAFMDSLFPDELRSLLVDPYIDTESGQARITARVIESDPDLQRQALLEKIQVHLNEHLGLSKEQFRFTSLVVLYNNMLQSLFSSQIKTLGFVLVSIMGMFLVLFRSWKVAVVAILPNILAPAVVLGMMGLVGLPLDMMTITIAAISVGIAVDNTIHYLYRFRSELQKDGDYHASMYRSHGSIGRAMYYTSITIILGFSILAFSNFNPTIYFGLFTGLAMLIALLSSLTLLPQLLIQAKPFKV